MGLWTNVVAADPAEAKAVAESDDPTAEWEGFTIKGFDHVKLCTLFSLLRTGSPSQDFDRQLDSIRIESVPEEGPVLCSVVPEQLAELAGVAQFEDTEFDELVAAWGGTEEFEGWSESDVAELLRDLGDLAESASLQGKSLVLCTR